MEGAYALADRVALITPARFLFNAGSTPKAWNKKMLADPHLKVESYEADSSKIFPGTDIKGGVAITYRDAKKNFGAIGTFTAFPELNTIKKKVTSHKPFAPLSTIIVTAYAYHFTETLYTEHPELRGHLSKGHDYDLKSNALERIPEVFFEQKPDDGHNYIKIYGLIRKTRAFRWIRKDYVNEPENLCRWKVFMPAANGSGALGEVLTTPIIGSPIIGSTETFISIGSFETQAEAEACLKYVKTKFARTLLGILKVTAHITPEKWIYVPLQDFTAGSDIGWGRSVHEIDEQLYKKYGLSSDEVAFIEGKVKEMA